MIEPADLAWRDGQPYSPAFGDIYHDVDGTAEVESVLLEPAGFSELLTESDQLLIGELGFGTGLNFAVIARRCMAAGVRLHFVSFEAAPIDPDSFRKLSRNRATTEPAYTELARSYPPLLNGWHRRRYYGGRVTLHVFWGNADEGLEDLGTSSRQPFDLWLLDGFAPDRNPEMWSPDLFEKIAGLSSRGTRLTTFTSVGQVRRNLAAQGFSMRRVNQRPRKWESLAGTFEQPGRDRIAIPNRVRVAGAGIAGASVARELAMSGIAVEVVEAGAQIASGASGIPVTVMHPRLHHDGSPVARLKAMAYTQALAAIEPYLDAEDSGIQTTGALQIASPNYPPERLAAVADCYAGTGLHAALINPQEAARLAGTALDDGTFDGPVLWFPDACTVHTPQFTRTLLDHPLIDVRTSASLEDWPAGPTILACGFASQRFSGASYLELGLVHGQLDIVSAPGGDLGALRVPVVGNGYVAPAGLLSDATALIAAGATYEYEPWPTAKASSRNHAHIERLSKAAWEAHAQHKATRSVSSDRNPIIGSLYDLAQQACVDRYVTTGHGSMGTVTSHLGAGLLDALLHGHGEPLQPELAALVSPRRFRIRQARRGYRFGATA